MKIDILSRNEQLVQHLHKHLINIFKICISIKIFKIAFKEKGPLTQPLKRVLSPSFPINLHYFFLVTPIHFKYKRLVRNLYQY